MRLSAQHANAIPVAVAVATMGIEEVIALADSLQRRFRDSVAQTGSASASNATWWIELSLEKSIFKLVASRSQSNRN